MFHEGICAENLRFSYSEGAEVLCGFFPFGFQWWGQFFGRIGSVLEMCI